jgi:hypothetical protein
MVATHSASHDEDTMMMGSTESTMMMVPYLHFTPGDAILFREWVPKEPGPFVGACIGLFLLGIFDRWLAAMRRLMEAWWKQRCALVLDPRSCWCSDLNAELTIYFQNDLPSWITQHRHKLRSQQRMVSPVEPPMRLLHHNREFQHCRYGMPHPLSPLTILPEAL